VCEETIPVDSFAVSTTGPDGTSAVAARLAPHLRAGDAVLLTGGLATGKTTFVKALALALDSPSAVTSPTFTLAQFYDSRAGPILHIDAYRLSGIHEYRDLGLAEYMDGSITLVEWGEKVAEDFLCHLVIEFRCGPDAPDVRALTFSADCDRWGKVITAMRGALREEPRLGDEARLA